jgi:putative phosphoribosyl transferase
MKNRVHYLFVRQEHATKQLISRLTDYKNKKCCVVAVSNNAVTIAKEVARKLNADLFFIPSIVMNDPAGSPESLGVVSFNYVITHDLRKDIPRDYIYRQALALRSKLFARYPGVYTPLSEFQNRVVILVDDLVQNSEKVLALLETVQKQKPQEIVVAIPLIARGAAHRIMEEDASVIFMHMTSKYSMDKAYLNFSALTDAEAIALLRSDTCEVIQDKALHGNTVTSKKEGRGSLSEPHEPTKVRKETNKSFA